MDLLWIWLLVGVGTGVMIGIGVTLYAHQSVRRKLAALEAVEAEYKTYRKDVAKHFVGTAGLVNNLTQSYKAVYDHLEEGAHSLIGEEFRKELGQASDPALISSLGQSASNEAAAPALGAPQEAPQPDTARTDVAKDKVA